MTPREKLIEEITESLQKFDKQTGVAVRCISVQWHTTSEAGKRYEEHFMGKITLEMSG